MAKLEMRIFAVLLSVVAAGLCLVSSAPLRASFGENKDIKPHFARSQAPDALAEAVPEAGAIAAGQSLLQVEADSDDDQAEAFAEDELSDPVQPLGLGDDDNLAAAAMLELRQQEAAEEGVEEADEFFVDENDEDAFEMYPETEEMGEYHPSVDDDDESIESDETSDEGV